MIMRKRYAKLEKRVEPEGVDINVICGHCQAADQISWGDLFFSLGGGCGGHGPDEYCYCSGNYYTAYFMCRGCKKPNYIAFEEGST